MRSEIWFWLDKIYTPGNHLLELGCGTGLDAIRMARLGYHIMATDWSLKMVERTSIRAKAEGLSSNIVTAAIGAHELNKLNGVEIYDGAYSNFGPLNCVNDLTEVSRECARLLKPGSTLFFTVIGRICPWEIGYYAYKRQWARLKVRFDEEEVPVQMNQKTIWTRYYTPMEFYQAFKSFFTLTHYRGLCLFAPPPYLYWMRERYLRWYELLWYLDRHNAGWPLLQDMGDHFLIVMKKRT